MRVASSAAWWTSAALMGVLALAACTGESARVAEPSGDVSSVETSAATASDSTPLTPEPTSSEVAALPAAPTTAPETASGPLSSETLPTARELGSGWKTRVEGADEEEGVGNGTAYQARDPQEIVETTVPLGCERRSPSPVPRNVLQSTYRHADTGAYAVALRMRFESAEDAEEFAKVRRRDVVACRDQPDDPYSGAPAPVRVVSGGSGRQLIQYQLVGEKSVWISALQIKGSDVLTLDTDANPGRLVDWEGLGYQEP